MSGGKEKVTIDTLRRAVWEDDDLKTFFKEYLERYRINERFIEVWDKNHRWNDEGLDFYMLLMNATIQSLPACDAMLYYLWQFGKITEESCCGIINAINQRRRNNRRFEEGTAAAVIDELQREGRLIQYRYMYGETMLDPKSVHYFVLPYRFRSDWEGNTMLNVVMLADGYLFPKKMDLKKEGNKGTWKLRGVLSPLGELVSFSEFLKLKEAMRHDDGDDKRSRLESFAWLKANGIPEPDDLLINALSETEGLKKIRSDTLSVIRKNPVWRADRYVMKAGLIAAAVLGGFEDDDSVRERALSFMESMTECFPTAIYMRHYDGDTDVRKKLQKFIKGGVLRYVPAGSTDSGSYFVPRYGSREAREKLNATSWLKGRLKDEKSRRAWLGKLRLPDEFAKKEIQEIEDPEQKRIALYLLQFLYMPKDAPDYFSVNREAFKGKEGMRALRELKELIWSRGDLSSDIMDPSIFHAMKPEYEPDFAEFFMHHYHEIKADAEIRAMLPQMQEAWGSIQYHRSLNQRKYKDLPPWKMSFSDIFKIMAETRYDRRIYSDSRYDEAELLCARYGYRQSGFDKACCILDRMTERRYTSIPDISGVVGAFSYRMLALDDIAAVFFGHMLDCCQMLGGAGKSCMYHSCTSENGRVFMITDREGRPVAGSWVWRNGSTVCFDNIEGVRPAAERAVITIYLEAARKLASSVSDGDVIRKVTFGGGCSDIPTDGFEADNENSYPIEDISYIADSRKQFILFFEKDAPERHGKENTPAVYENSDRTHMKIRLIPGRKKNLDAPGSNSYLGGGYRKHHFGFERSGNRLFTEFKVGELAEAMENFFGDMKGVVRAEKERVRKKVRQERLQRIKRLLFA